VTVETVSAVSERARTLLRGAFDMHVHVAPDVFPRRIDDLSLARRVADLGLGGFQLKSHYGSTAERASVVRAAVPGVGVLGAITLNRAVGGMNPLAVEIAAREGARTVWFPTVDSVDESAGETRFRPGAKVPVWLELQRELRAAGVEIEPVPVVDAEGVVLPETRAVLRTVERHGMVLATGHLSRDEIFAVVDAAREEGVREIVITHPDFPSQSISIEDQVSLAGRGALLERCFTTPHTGKIDWESVFEAIRATGPESSVLSTDLGQLANPPVEDGLGLMADRLLAAGFDEDAVHGMAVVNTRRLAGVEACAGCSCSAPTRPTSSGGRAAPSR
jgi:sugar phosphate isomerase/epimerase